MPDNTVDYEWARYGAIEAEARSVPARPDEPLTVERLAAALHRAHRSMGFGSCLGMPDAWHTHEPEAIAILAAMADGWEMHPIGACDHAQRRILASPSTDPDTAAGRQFLGYIASLSDAYSWADKRAGWVEWIRRIEAGGRSVARCPECDHPVEQHHDYLDNCWQTWCACPLKLQPLLAALGTPGEAPAAGEEYPNEGDPGPFAEGIPDTAQRPGGE